MPKMQLSKLETSSVNPYYEVKRKPRASSVALRLHGTVHYYTHYTHAPRPPRAVVSTSTIKATALPPHTLQ